MVGKVIRDYIEGGGRKLTVPGFGTFMRKDTGEVIFVDLLKKDDGLLRQLVEDFGYYSEVEAMALVDRFIFETKNDIEHSGSATVEGFGIMTLDDKGIYQFDYSPRTTPKREHAVQEQLFGEQPSEDAAEVRSSKSQAKSTPEASKTAKTAQTLKPRKRLRKADIYMIIAIVAAAIAIAVMVIANFSDKLPFVPGI